MKSLRKAAPRPRKVSQRHNLPITFEDHFWVAEIKHLSIAVSPLQHFVLFSPGAYMPADNPGGLSQITCAPRRIHLHRR